MGLVVSLIVGKVWSNTAEVSLSGRICNNRFIRVDIAAENLEIRLFAYNETFFLRISPMMIPFGVIPVCWFAAILWINGRLGTNPSASRDVGNSDSYIFRRRIAFGVATSVVGRKLAGIVILVFVWIGFLIDFASVFGVVKNYFPFCVIDNGGIGTFGDFIFTREGCDINGDGLFFSGVKNCAFIKINIGLIDEIIWNAGVSYGGIFCVSPDVGGVVGVEENSSWSRFGATIDIHGGSFVDTVTNITVFDFVVLIVFGFGCGVAVGVICVINGIIDTVKICSGGVLGALDAESVIPVKELREKEATTIAHVSNFF